MKEDQIRIDKIFEFHDIATEIVRTNADRLCGKCVEFIGYPHYFMTFREKDGTGVTGEISFNSSIVNRKQHILKWGYGVSPYFGMPPEVKNTDNMTEEEFISNLLDLKDYSNYLFIRLQPMITTSNKHTLELRSVIKNGNIDQLINGYNDYGFDEYKDLHLINLDRQKHKNAISKFIRTIGEKYESSPSSQPKARHELLNYQSQLRG